MMSRRRCLDDLAILAAVTPLSEQAVAQGD
jgi:hypothetical protein